MNDNHPPENNDRTLQQLAWALEASVGQFKLILAKCNYTNLRDRLLVQLPKICRVEISILTIQQTNRTLYSAIREEFGEKLPACLMVVGLEDVQDLPQMLSSANQVREEFRKHCPFPLVLWINDEVHKQLMQVAPDLESWAITRNFAISKQDLVAFLQKTADQWFRNNLSLSLAGYRRLETELQAAQRDLLDDTEFNSLEIQADIVSLLGLIKQVNHQLDAALEHYQTALTLWQKTNNLERQVKIIGNIALCYYLKAAKYLDINNYNWQKTQDYLQQYIDLLAQIQNPQLIADAIEQLGDILRDVRIWQQFQNLADQLKSFAQQALVIHQVNNQPRELAKDYGFLAEVALVQKSWQDANDFIQQALQIWSAIPHVESGLFSELPEKLIAAHDFSLYQFILALSQYHLGQIQDAITSLETAKKHTNPLKDLKLYIQILDYLQRLYFEQQEYAQAYEIKQQQRSVEQQFGLRAFIGAGRLGSTKQVFAETVASATLKENISPEIAASGRLLDVERLIERIGRPDYKLIVIHGQSGVGKSSLINAGLVPALKQKAIGIQDNLPVVMRFYSHWEEELGRVMFEALRERRDGEDRGDEGDEGDEGGESLSLEVQALASEQEISHLEHERPSSKREISHLEHERPSSEHDTPSLEHERPSSEHDTPSLEHERPSSEHDTPSLYAQTSSSSPLSSSSRLNLLAQLRENEAKNLRTVLIFDQFEEFFFTYPEPAQRRQFFEFLGECFNVLSVKVILSLRLDYLHYLLECNDLPNMQIINNDILSKNVLYKLGNFSPSDAKSIIQRLTENTSFRLEPTLVDQLVQDLASELGEVRPIELQVIGAQLQTENITTLAEYRQRGTKEQLVKHYLNEVVHDCGADNQQLADLLLYLLTDEKGTRPLRTLVELERDLQAFVKEENETRKQRNRRRRLRKSQKYLNETHNLPKESSLSQKLELVLEIFVKSGLVVLLKENPAGRYQLVHDYLAAFIRQQQEPKLKELMAELENERKQRKLGEAKLNRLLKLALIVSVTAGLVFGSLAIISWRWALEAEAQKKQAEINEINSLVNSSATFSASGQTRDAIIEVLKAVKKLQKLNPPPAITQMHVVGRLREAVYLQPQNKFQELQTLSDHNSPVNGVAFSPDGQQLASGSNDSTIKIWDVSTGKVIQTIPHLRDATPTASYIDSSYQDSVTSIAFSSDGKKLASGSEDKTIKLWDISSGKLLQTFNGHSGLIKTIALSSDGQKLASGSEDKTIKLWDVTTGKLLQTFSGHSDVVNSVAFSSDGQKLASGSKDKTIKLWDISTGKVLQTFNGHSDAVNSVAFSSDGQKLASGSDDNTIKLWNFNNSKVPQTLSGHSNPVNSVAFSRDGKQLLSGSNDKTIKLWDVSTGKLLQTLSGHREAVNSVAFRGDGQQLVSGSNDHTIKLWNVTIGKVQQTLPSDTNANSGHEAWVNSFAFSSDGKRLVSGSNDYAIKLWDVTTGQLLHTFSGHRGAVNSVALSSDRKKLASGSDDKTIKLWDVSTGQLLQTFPSETNAKNGHRDWVKSVAFSPDGKQLASGSKDKTIKIWDVNTGKVLYNFRGFFVFLNSGHRDSVNSVTFSPDGKQLASGSSDNTIKIWDVTIGKLLQTLPGERYANSGHLDWVNTVAFSLDGKRLASGSNDNTIKIWELSTGRVLQTLNGHSDLVNSIAFSPDGKQLVSGSDDSTIKLWDVSTGKVLKTITSNYGNWVRSVAFSPDGKRLASASTDNKITLWNFNLDELVKDGCGLINNYLIVHPETLAELDSCQNPSLLLQAATVLIMQGEKLAPVGDTDGAIAKFRQAQKWNANLKFDPEAKAQDLAGRGK
ncbi:ribosome assembly protein 4 [Tolypothrix sp. PCC 7910]|uniref:WD40 domain-containing protein n=1 Tax=Tolypothrix sp. PCC 7910 TaxID=2099387 RepID=UPI0014279DC1|nr:ribosome assembly protein 4 [Tolypothrix sp. PCC 7910]QIR40962.1 ribosome assembly protein 4 [Tolypothrix sp. PCC 7910]